MMIYNWIIYLYDKILTLWSCSPIYLVGPYDLDFKCAYSWFCYILVACVRLVESTNYPKNYFASWFSFKIL